jgi:hypothetical protein
LEPGKYLVWKKEETVARSLLIHAGRKDFNDILGLNFFKRGLSIHLTSRVADLGCLSRIPGPDFFPSRIPDPESKISSKREGGK